MIRFMASRLLVILLPLLLVGQVRADTAYGDSPPFYLDSTGFEDAMHVYGFVLDARNDHPIADAYVELGESVVAPGAFTRADGRFFINNINPLEYPPGEYTLYVATPTGGYRETSAQVTTIAGQSASTTVRMESRVVVLLHGIKSSGDIWTTSWGDHTFRSYLLDGGFIVPSPISFTNACDHIGKLAALFSTYWEDLLESQNVWSFSVVAHSAGGLVTRRSLVPDKGYNIHKFIMLGTPNHGSPVARLQHIIPRIYEEIFCSSHLIGMIDELDLGSGFLDLLNYGVQDVPSEGNWSSDCGTHGAEWLYGLDRNHVYCIGGTSPCGTVCEKVHPFICGDNDGIVSTRSAYLWAIPPGNFWLDTQLRDAAGQVVHADHFQSDCSYSINPGIAKAVREILDGDPPAHIDRASAPETQSVDDPIQLLPPLVGTTLLSAPFTDTSLVTPATQAVFQCYWKDVPLSYAVVSPGGVVIDEAYAETSPLVLHIATDLSSNFIVQDPETGNWAHQVNTTSAVEPDSLWILVSHDSDIVLEPSVTSGIDPHGSFDCSVALTEADAPIAGSSVSAAVRTPLGDSLELPLLDDGSGGDPVAGDGVFTATLGAAGVPGTYVFVFTGTGDIPGLGIFERVAVATGRAESLPNIAVAETGLRASTSESLLGLGVELACTFENTGAAIADTVRLQILSAEANAVVADTLVSMVPGQAVELRGDWHTNVVGTVSFAASANVIGAGSEVSYIDNGDSTSVLVGHPASGSTAVEAVDPSVDPENTTGEESPRVLHFKTYPNPFNPATKIRFEVQGGEAHVRLRIYDLRGQLVRTLIDRRLGRGAHERTWDARDNRGLRVSSGAYFCRIEVSSSIFTRKMMVVK